MIHLIQKFTAHPVGQGLFYSGHVAMHDNGVQALPANIFNFVFDCGSLNKANATDEVTHYRNHRLPDGTDLDLLVISHFDADHVNHIKILLDKRKVKKVVLPFAPLQERLYLVLNHYDQLGRDDTPDDFFIRFTLDPIGTLGPYLSGDGTIYIVTSDPDEPFPDPEKDAINQSSSSGNDDNGLTFDVNATDIDSTVANQFFITDNAGGKVKMFKDSEKGFLKSGDRTFFMEFLFYRRDLSPQNDAFFKAVYETFLKKHRLKPSTPLDKLIEVVKGIRHAIEIERIFEDVKKAFPGIDLLGRDIADLNTTALCMLHYNLKSIYTLNIPVRRWDWAINTIKKFDGTNRTRIEEHMCCLYRYIYSPLPEENPFTRFPNCLLTSDTFLKTLDEINEFHNKYLNYWERFWLFQLPHHGSTASAGSDLLQRLPTHPLAKFINHGAKRIRRWQHPSPQLINDLVAAGQSVNVFPVNEFTGLSFEVIGRL